MHACSFNCFHLSNLFSTIKCTNIRRTIHAAQNKLWVYSGLYKLVIPKLPKVHDIVEGGMLRIQWQREEGKGGHAPTAALFRGGISRKIKNCRPVYGHLNALPLSISVHQRCSVTFKIHQIHILPGLRPITLGSFPHSL